MGGIINNPLNRILGNGTQYGERKYYMGTEVSRLPYPGIKNLSTIRSTIHFNIRNDRGNKVNAGTITQYVKRNDKN